MQFNDIFRAGEGKHLTLDPTRQDATTLSAQCEVRALLLPCGQLNGASECAEANPAHNRFRNPLSAMQVAISLLSSWAARARSACVSTRRLPLALNLRASRSK